MQHLCTQPGIDTQQLSPPALPQNPYHRLIKNYKLINDSLNSPLANCKATATLFDDQIAAFSTMQQCAPQRLRIYHGLLATNSGYDQLFRHIRQNNAPAPDTLVQDIKHLLEQNHIYNPISPRKKP
ncbi:hypothetical protein KRX19_07000 [Cardiobacteriaceae bacterium TAE3-ERU3]|nr:hypothetical protein [Cardiobacteriaceae bacterium TAE3-ERU3]